MSGWRSSHTVPVSLALLGAAGFLSSAGGRVVDALLDPMAREFGVGVPRVALVLAAFTIPYGVLQLVIGPLADRVGKVRVLMTALVAYAFATGGCALAPDLPVLTAMRALAGGASAGLIPVCLAYIGDTSAYEVRQLTLSRFLNGVVLAQIMAGPVGGVFGQFVSWRGVFVVLAAAALVLAALLAATRPGAPPAGPVLRRNYGSLVRSPPARRLLLLALVNGAAFSGTVPFLAPFLHETFGLSYLLAGSVLAFFGLGTMIYIRNAKALIARFGEAGLVAAGALTAAVGMALAAGAPVAPLYVVAEILLGLGYFMLHSVLLARATELLPDARSTSTSAFTFMLFTGQAFGALLCARGIEVWGYRAVFGVDTAVILVLGGLLWRLLRRR